MSLLFTLLSKNVTAFSTNLYCLVEFLFKFFDKSVNKRDFLKIIKWYASKQKAEKDLEKRIS